MTGLYRQIPRIIFFLLPEYRQGLARAIRIFRSLLSLLFHSYALAVARTISGYFVRFENYRFAPSKKTVISWSSHWKKSVIAITFFRKNSAIQVSLETRKETLPGTVGHNGWNRPVRRSWTFRKCPRNWGCGLSTGGKYQGRRTGWSTSWPNCP